MNGSGQTRNSTVSCLSGTGFQVSSGAFYLLFGSGTGCGVGLLGLKKALTDVFDIFQGNLRNIVEE